MFAFATESSMPGADDCVGQTRPYKTAASTAPVAVAIRFTPSLVIHRTRPSTVAPRMLSTVIPMNPASQMAAGCVPNHAILNPAITAAPTQAAIVPSQVTPPDVPGGTSARVPSTRAVISRGGVLLSRPISVAHVSAVEAAMAPAKAAWTHGVGETPAQTASSAATVPFA